MDELQAWGNLLCAGMGPMLREDPPTLTQGRALVVGGLRATLCCKSEVEGELSVQQWRALLRDLAWCLW